MRNHSDPTDWLPIASTKDNRRVRLERRTAQRRARWAAKQGRRVAQ